jgi:hypothetical protein
MKTSLSGSMLRVDLDLGGGVTLVEQGKANMVDPAGTPEAEVVAVGPV